MVTAPLDALRVLLERVPLTEEQQAEAAELVQQCSSQQLASLGLAPPPRPVVPKGLEKLALLQRLAAVQKVITSIEYNHKAGYMYNVSKDRPFSRIMDTAREVLREALPIKCIEAVFLGALLTAGWEGVHRMPLRFKSMANGQTYKHIVLVIHHMPSNKWGALGISRRSELMYKEMSYDSLADLVLDYKQGYEQWWHKLLKASIGLPFEHDLHYNGPVCWRYCNVSPSKHPWEKVAATLTEYAATYKGLLAKFRVLGYPPPRAALQPRDIDAENSSLTLGGVTTKPATGSTGSVVGAAAAYAPGAAAVSSPARAPRHLSPSRDRSDRAAGGSKQQSPALHRRKGGEGKGGEGKGGEGREGEGKGGEGKAGEGKEGEGKGGEGKGAQVKAGGGKSKGEKSGHGKALAGDSRTRGQGQAQEGQGNACEDMAEAQVEEGEKGKMSTAAVEAGAAAGAGPGAGGGTGAEADGGAGAAAGPGAEAGAGAGAVVGAGAGAGAEEELMLLSNAECPPASASGGRGESGGSAGASGAPGAAARQLGSAGAGGRTGTVTAPAARPKGSDSDSEDDGESDYGDDVES